MTYRGGSSDRWQTGPSFRPQGPVPQSYPRPSNRPPTKVMPDPRSSIRKEVSTARTSTRIASPGGGSTPARPGPGTPSGRTTRPATRYPGRDPTDPRNPNNSPNRASPRPSGRVKATPVRPSRNSGQPLKGGHKSGPPSSVSSRPDRHETRYDDRRSVTPPFRKRREDVDVWPPPNHRFVVWNGDEYESRPPPCPTVEELNRASPYSRDYDDRRNRERERRRHVKIVKCVNLSDTSFVSQPYY